MLDAFQLASLRRIVEADVRHIARTWFEWSDPEELRREAVVLRRLLVDNGGDLARLWREEGRAGVPMIASVADLRRFPHWRGLAFGVVHQQALGGGVELGELMLWSNEAAEDPALRAQLEAPVEDSDLPIQGFLDSVCLVVREMPVRRRDLISYIANRRGGAHFDTRDRAGDPRRHNAHRVLDELERGGWSINLRNAALAQLAAIGEDVVRSPDIRTLVDGDTDPDDAES